MGLYIYIGGGEVGLRYRVVGIRPRGIGDNRVG